MFRFNEIIMEMCVARVPNGEGVLLGMLGAAVEEEVHHARRLFHYTYALASSPHPVIFILLHSSFLFILFSSSSLGGRWATCRGGEHGGRGIAVVNVRTRGEVRRRLGLLRRGNVHSRRQQLSRPHANDGQ